MGLGLGLLGSGLRFYEDEFLRSLQLTQIRFPRSKKKRIRNKWKKATDNPRIWNVRLVPDPNIYRMNGMIVGHPATLKKVRAAIESNDRCS